MNNKKTILYLVPTSKIGGAEISLFALIKKLDKNKFDPIVYLPFDGLLYLNLEKLGIKCIEHKRYSFFSISKKKIKKIFKRIEKNLRKIKINLIHSNSIYTLGLASYIGEKLKIPVVNHWRDNFITEDLKYFLKRNNNIYNIAISKAVKKTIMSSNIKQLNIEIVYNGVDLDLFKIRDKKKQRDKLNLPEEKIIIGFFSRIFMHKGLQFIIDAIKCIEEDILLLIVGAFGEIKAKEYFQELFLKNNIKEKIKYIGFKNDIYNYFSAVDFVVVPSENEALSRTTIEAFASGKPVLAHKVGGLQDLIIDGENGFFVDFQNIEMWRKKILYLSNNSNLVNKMGKNASKFSKNFSIIKYVNNIEQIYENIDPFIEMSPIKKIKYWLFE